MDTKICLRLQKGIGPSNHNRAVQQLRAAAADSGRSEDRRQLIRDATRC